jgi:hypothetical protein
MENAAGHSERDEWTADAPVAEQPPESDEEWPAPDELPVARDPLLDGDSPVADADWEFEVAPQASDEQPDDEGDDFRRSALEAYRARRAADAWSESLTAKIARLERRTAALTGDPRPVDSDEHQPRKEPS